MIIRHASTRGRTRSYVRGYENDEYLKESSIGRILDHDYNTRERGPTRFYEDMQSPITSGPHQNAYRALKNICK